MQGLVCFARLLCYAPLAALATAATAHAQCQTPITPFDGDGDNYHGFTVTMHGHVAALGAPHDDTQGPRSGSVYVVDVVSGQGLHKLTGSNGRPNDLFGTTLALSQDHLVVGAPGPVGTWGGRVYVFDLTTGAELAELVPSKSPRVFGETLDVDAGRVVVGDERQGVAYVFDAATGAELHRLRDSAGPYTSFGASVAIEGDRVVVGAFNRGNAHGEKGVAIVFDAVTGRELLVVDPPAPAPHSFGFPVAAAGGRMFVGTWREFLVFDLATGQHLGELDTDHAYASVIAVDDEQAVITTGGLHRAYVFDIEKAKQIEILGPIPTGVTSLGVGEGRWLLSSGHQDAAYLFDVEDDDGDGFANCEDLGSSYCGPAVPNSTGVPAVIAAGGSALVAQNDLRLRALSLPPHKPGFFLASRTQGFVPMPGGSQGNLCLGGQIGRLRSKAKSSGKNGKFAIQVGLGAVPPGMQVVQPGEDWNFQAWYRDVNPISTSNFTDAVNVVFE